MTTTTTTALIDKKRVAASLYGMLVGDAVAMPAHWFYSPTKLRADYGEVTEMVAPKATHAESMVQGMSYAGTIDIMHDKARFYTGNSLAAEAQKLTKEEIEARRDEHGNYIGVTEDSRVHYHATLKKGQNTVNGCIARLAMRYIAEKNAGQVDGYDPDEFLERFVEYMKTKPDPKNDSDQLLNHNDVYMDVYVRHFFEMLSQGKRLRDCPKNQRDQWSIGSLDGVVMSIPTMAAYANEPEAWVIGRAVEHHMLTHRSITVTAVISVLVPLLLELWHGAPLKESLDKAMDKMRPPKITGRELRDSYVGKGGPGRIPKDKKWLQHMQLMPPGTTTKDLVHELIKVENDEDVAGCGDREASRLSTMCYCEQSFTVVLYLAYKYGSKDPRKALLQNVMIGGHSTARGAVLGAILGAAHGVEGLPFVDDLCAKEEINKEVKGLIATL